MPPSGYSTQQANFIVEFLRSCAGELEREALEFQYSYQQRLTKEIDDISAYLKLDEVKTRSQRAVLELTAHFYSGVRAKRPGDAREYWAAVEQVAADVGNSVTAIHIDQAALARGPMRAVAAE